LVSDKLPIVVAVTGATGSIYGLTLARTFLEKGYPVWLLVSQPGSGVVETETDRSLDSWIAELSALGELHLPKLDDFAAAISSGSFLTIGMIIAPCSMGTLGRIAAGVSTSLIERAADVCLKERRRLVLLARETPLSAIHLKNMLTVTEAGGIILPPVPAFYTRPKTVEDIVLHTVERVCDLFADPLSQTWRWTGVGRS